MASGLRRLGLILVLLVPLAGAPTTAQEAPCPADWVARLGRPVSELQRIAQEAAGSTSTRCARLGELLARYLDREEFDICGTQEKPTVGGPDEDGADALALRGALAWRCGNVRAAHGLAIRALRADPEATLAWTLLGRVLDGRFRFEPARRAYEKALQLDAEETGALMGLAKLTPDRQKRKEYLQSCIEAGPSRGELEENLRAAEDNIRLIDVLGERPVWVLEQMELPATLRLRPLVDRPGSIGGWMIPIKLGDAAKIPTLLDTGASGLHVAPKTARKAGLTALSAGTLVGGGESGEHGIRHGLLSKLDMGPITYSQALALVAQESLHPAGSYRAIMGADLLEGLLLRVDPSSKRLEITESSASPPADDPLEADPWRGETEGLSIVRVDGQLLIPVELGEENNSLRVLMLLDTAATQSVLDLSVARRLPAFRTNGNRRIMLYGGAGMLAGNVGTVSLGAGPVRARLRNVPVVDFADRSRLSGIHFAGLLGLDVLGKQPFEIDLARGTVRLGAAKPF